MFVKEIGPEFGTVNGKQMLAGKALCFDIEIAEVRMASEELEHQHVHGPGGHHH